MKNVLLLTGRFLFFTDHFYEVFQCEVTVILVL